MSSYKSFAELKSLARVQMTGKFPVLIGGFLLQELILTAATAIAISLFPGADLISTTLYSIVAFLIQLFGGILSVGASLLCLHAACGMTCKISDLFYGFRYNPDKAIGIQLVFAILNTICMLPSEVLGFTSGASTEYEALMKTSLAMLLGLIVYMVVTLPLFPVFFLMLDFPKLTVKELFKKSREIMKGNCLRYLLLQLSFFPIMLLLGMLTCGIAFLWITPYMNITFANFYLDIMACRNKQLRQDAIPE